LKESLKDLKKTTTRGRDALGKWSTSSRRRERQRDEERDRALFMDEREQYLSKRKDVVA
jgi:hypothetical protein